MNVKEWKTRAEVDKLTETRVIHDLTLSVLSIVGGDLCKGTFTALGVAFYHDDETTFIA